jgi:zinc protease
MILRRFTALLAALSLAACAAQPARLASASTPKPDWAFQKSDLPVDPAFRFGRLANGMRFILRRNATPPGTALVRMNIAAGSLDEGDNERGFAHFVEHMAFNGSAHVPEGEMVKLLEREGLAFGADTNAQTSFEQTLYMLDLPRADPKLLDTALMIMRETASELTFDPAAVARERGVVLSELRDGQGYALDNFKDQMAFLYPRAHYPQRLPIGTPESLNAATAAALKSFWMRHYVPANAVLMIVGDFDPDLAEAALRARFADWQPAPPQPRPDQGKVLQGQKAQTRVHLDPALSERVIASRHGPWRDEPDSIAVRRLNLLRQIGYGAVNRRFQRMTRVMDPPFRGAGLGTADVFKIGKTTNLVVDTADKGWRRGLMAASEAYAAALAGGFNADEIAEQMAGIRSGIENAAAGAATRSNGALIGAALALVRDDAVPTTPAGALERFNQFAPQITPAAVLAALKAEARPLTDPLIRFQGRTAPEGGAPALAAAWKAALRAGKSAPPPPPLAPFAYTDFGPAGKVVSDTTEPALGIRSVRFANGVRLNLKRTTLEADRIQLRLALDGGELLETRDNPLAVEMAAMLASGGLGKHSQDDLQTLLAGRSVSNGIAAGGDAFSVSATTIPRDLELELQLLAATISDPGYRPEPESLFHQNMTNYFARLNATPGSALSGALSGILSPGDPRFVLQPPQDYQKLTFAKLRTDISDRLAHGAIELALVGDLDPDAAIALVGRTLGALPPREAEFLPYGTARQRAFTAQRGLAVIRHEGEANQAIVRMVWPTTDDSDPVAAMTLELLQEVAGIAVTDTVREALGTSYSPSVQSSLSRVWRKWGTFTINASVNLADVAKTRASIEGTVRALADHPVDPDVLKRAREPMRERLDNALKTNGGWLALAERAASRPDRIDRYLQAKARLDAITPAALQATARRYLALDQAVTVLVLPKEAQAPEK